MNNSPVTAAPVATWLNKGYAEKLVKAAQGYWDNSKDWLLWATNQRTEQHSIEPILSLLAYERLTSQIDKEPVSLFRKRVQHAFVNTVEAGEISSIVNIFGRLGIEVIKVTERIDGRDWDVIALDFSSHTVSKYGEFLPELIQLYGRACRRYEFTVHSVVESNLSTGLCDVQWDSVHVNHQLSLIGQNELNACSVLAFLGAQYDIHQATI